MASTAFNFYEVEGYSPIEVGDAPWSSSTRVCFRFGCLLAALIILPFPFDLLPGTRFVSEQYAAAWSAIIAWCSGQAGVTDPDPGSVQLIVSAILAFLGTLAWTIVDSGGERSHTSLLRLVGTLLRFWIACAMLDYGVGRVFDPATLAEGIVACTAAALLGWRRTSTIGALAAAAVLSSLAVQTYDVLDVRSWELLAVATILVIAEAPRLALAFLGYATRDRYAGQRFSIGWTLARAWVVFWIVYTQIDAQVVWTG